MTNSKQTGAGRDNFLHDESRYITPFEQGRAARLSSKRRLCPFMADTEHAADWCDGFDSVSSSDKQVNHD